MKNHYKNMVAMIKLSIQGAVSQKNATPSILNVLNNSIKTLLTLTPRPNKLIF